MSCASLKCYRGQTSNGYVCEEMDGNRNGHVVNEMERVTAMWTVMEGEMLTLTTQVMMASLKDVAEGRGRARVVGQTTGATKAFFEHGWITDCRA